MNAQASEFYSLFPLKKFQFSRPSYSIILSARKIRLGKKKSINTVSRKLTLKIIYKSLTQFGKKYLKSEFFQQKNRTTTLPANRHNVYIVLGYTLTIPLVMRSPGLKTRSRGTLRYGLTYYRISAAISNSRKPRRDFHNENAAYAISM